MRIKKFIFAVFYLCMVASVLGIAPTTEIIKLNHKQAYYEDTGKTITIKDLLDTNQVLLFQQKEKFAPGNSLSRFWGHYLVENEFPQRKDFAMMITASSLNMVKFYQVKHGKIIDSTYAGVDYPFSERQLFNNNCVFKFSLPPNDSCSIYWMLQNRAGSLNTHFLLMTLDSFEKLDIKQDFIFNIFFGIQLCLVLLAIILFIAFKKKLYLFYGLYVAGFFLHFFSILGYSYQFLWPESPFIANISRILWVVLGSAVGSFFTMDLLGIRKKQYNILFYAFRSIQLFLFCFALLLIFGVQVDFGALLLKFNYFVMAIATIISIYAAIRTIPENKLTSYVYLFSFSPLLLVLIALILFNHGFIPYDPNLFSFINQYFFHTIIIAITIEVFIMMLALGVNFKTTEEQKIRLLARLEDLERQMQQQSTPVVTENKIPQPVISYDNEKELQQIHQRLLKIMQEQKVYLDEEMTLPKLAELINTTPHLLSKSINVIEKIHFFDFINLYRVAEAKILLKDPKKQKLTIEGIGFEVGFNNKTSFNKAFKKFTQLTPSQFKKQNL